MCPDLSDESSDSVARESGDSPDDEEGRSNVKPSTDVELQVGRDVDVGCDCCDGPCSATAAVPLGEPMRSIATGYSGDTEAFTATEGQCHEDDKMLVTPGSHTEAQIRILQELEEHLRTLVEEEDDTNVAAEHEPAWLHDDAPRCPLCKGYINADLSGSLGSPVRFLLECAHCRWDRCYEGEDAEWAAEVFYDAL